MRGAFSQLQRDEDGDTNQKIQSLAERIETNDDELAKEFAKIVITPAGEVAVANRLGAIANEMRRDASKSLIAKYFANQLQGEFLEKMNTAVQLAKSDIQIVDSALVDLRAQLSGESEADQLLTKLLKHDKAASALYFSANGWKGSHFPSSQATTPRVRGWRFSIFFDTLFFRAFLATKRNKLSFARRDI